MKRFMLMLLISTIAMSTTCTKEDNISSSSSNGTNISSSAVPAAVRNAFASRYQTASGQIEWEKEDGNTYKVKFFIGSQRMQAIFAADGSFLSERNI
ncbi:MAG: hypothetical protein WAT19_07485 [Ferruginibacter sp.]